MCFSTIQNLYNHKMFRNMLYSGNIACSFCLCRRQCPALRFLELLCNLSLSLSFWPMDRQRERVGNSRFSSLFLNLKFTNS